MTISEYNSCVDEYADNLYRFMLKQTGDSPSAKDLVQESYLKLWQKYEDVDYKKAKSYLFTTGYNKMIDNYKKTFLLPVIEELPSSFKNDLKQNQSSIISIWLYSSMAAAAVVLFGFFFFNKL